MRKENKVHCFQFWCLVMSLEFIWKQEFKLKKIGKPIFIRDIGKRQG